MTLHHQSEVLQRRTAVLHTTRNMVGTGAGEVVRQVANHSAVMGRRVRVLTDRPITGLHPAVELSLVPLSRWLYTQRSVNRVERMSRHLAQLVWFMVVGSVLACYYRFRGFYIFNHNVEIFGGDVLVMHNYFTAELRRDLRRSSAKIARLFNPVALLRVAREQIQAQLRTASGVIAVSEPAMTELRQYAARAGAKLSFVSNGVDADRFVPIPDGDKYRLRALLKIDASADLLLFVGHEFERKGLKLIIEAMGSLAVTNLHLAVIGGAGNSRESYESIAQQLGVGDRVHFLGTRNDVNEWMSAADVFVLPSSYETMPLVALEALAAGTPVVLSEFCPAAMLIKSEDIGAVCDLSALSVATAVAGLLRQSKTAEVEYRCRQAIRGYDWSTVTKNYLSLVPATSVGN